MDLESLVNSAAATLFGGAGTRQDDPTVASPLSRAVIVLRARGHSVQPSPGIPGLWEVSGMPELTTNQLINVALNPTR